MVMHPRPESRSATWCRCISSMLFGTIPLVTSLYQLSSSTILAVHTLMRLSDTDIEASDEETIKRYSHRWSTEITNRETKSLWVVLTLNVVLKHP